ncbi:MAG: hypothetical protein KF690_04475 [Bacteroidetes bacterium]|nr:hypothetical protein [Bacteroidota bacterium]
MRCGYPASEFIPVLNQLLQKFRPASVFVRILPEAGEPAEYQLSPRLAGGQGLGNPAYPLMAPGLRETPESAELKVALREKEVRLEHLDKELKETQGKLSALHETHQRLRKAYRKCKEQVEDLDYDKETLGYEKKVLQQELEELKDKLAQFQRKNGELMSPVMMNEFKGLLGDVLKDTGMSLLGHVLNKGGNGLGQPAPAFKAPVQAIARHLQHWTDEQLHYLHHVLASVSAQPELWAALRQLIPPPEVNTGSQEQPVHRRKPKVSFEAMK